MSAISSNSLSANDMIGSISKQAHQLGIQVSDLVRTNPTLAVGLVASGMIVGVVGYESGIIGKVKNCINNHKQMAAGIAIGTVATLGGVYYILKDHPRSLPDYLRTQFKSVGDYVSEWFNKN